MTLWNEGEIELKCSNGARFVAFQSMNDEWLVNYVAPPGEAQFEVETIRLRDLLDAATRFRGLLEPDSDLAAGAEGTGGAP